MSHSMESSALEFCKGRIHVLPECMVARWLVARSQQMGQPLAATVRHSKPESVFVENEILIDQNDHNTLSLLVNKYQADIVPFPAVPPQPDGMDPDRASSVAEMPLPVIARFNGEKISLDPLEEAAVAEPNEVLQVTSRAGAGTLALARQLVSEGKAIMPNMIGSSQILPLSAASEGSLTYGTPKLDDNPFNWCEFRGQSKVVQAWQLVQAYEQARGLHSPVFLGIFDAGFALDPNGRPMVINGQTPDVTNFIQWNLFYETLPDGFGIKEALEKLGESRFASGSNNEPGKEWHGNAVLSIAAAPMNNQTGAAGAGGLIMQSGSPLVVPVLFKMFRSAKETIRGLQLSVAWGVDIINMSWSITYPSAFEYGIDPSFPTKLWEQTFDWAAKRVVMFAAAGNKGEKLPDLVILPATRTPGVITVGALKNAKQTSDLNANCVGRNDVSDFSNYGSSVDIWAPGEEIHIMPEPGSPNGRLMGGTSFASPLTAGVAALMFAVNPNLRGRSDEVKRILRETAYPELIPGALASHTLNAQAAVLRAMGGRLPAAFGEEPNDTPQTARPLIELAPGVLSIQGTTLLSDQFDEDWYSFSTSNYSELDVLLTFVPELSTMDVTLVSDDVDSRVYVDQRKTSSQGQVRIQADLIAPSMYRLKVRGSGPNIYELRIGLEAKPLTPDVFEQNNSQKNATRFRMKRPSSFGKIGGEGSLAPRFYPGHYEANLHLANDVDYFHIDEIATLPLVKTIFEITYTDAPLDVAVLAADGTELYPTVRGKRRESVRLIGPQCWVRVSGSTANRYHFRLYDVLDADVIPRPWEEVEINPIPHSLPYPPDLLVDWEKFQQIEVTPELIDSGKLRLTGDEGLILDLIDYSGEVLASGQEAQTGETRSIDIDLSAIKPGKYIARIGRSINPAARFKPILSRQPKSFQIGPGW
jgi:subtilisin family serine protease